MKLDLQEYYINTPEHLSKIVEYIKQTETFTYEIVRSPKNPNKSLYLKLYKGNTSLALRLSDHHTHLTKNGGGICNLILDENVRNVVIYEKVARRVKELNTRTQRENLANLFKQIEEQLNANNKL